MIKSPFVFALLSACTVVTLLMAVVANNPMPLPAHFRNVKPVVINKPELPSIIARIWPQWHGPIPSSVPDVAYFELPPPGFDPLHANDRRERASPASRRGYSAVAAYSEVARHY
jgi:hypothetical protein